MPFTSYVGGYGEYQDKLNTYLPIRYRCYTIAEGGVILNIHIVKPTYIATSQKILLQMTKVIKKFDVSKCFRQ